MREIDVKQARSTQAGGCSACTDHIGPGHDYPVYEVALRGLTFRLCDKCLTEFEQKAAVASGRKPRNLSRRSKTPMTRETRLADTKKAVIQVEALISELERLDPQSDRLVHLRKQRADLNDAVAVLSNTNM